jgi:hypothetical protein
MAADFDNYTKRELTIEIGEASMLILKASVPIFIGFLLPFIVFWHNDMTFSSVISSLTGWKFFVVVVLGIPVHELLHALFFLISTHGKLSSIRFGIMREYLTPYCHCSQPMKIRAYMIAAAAPGVILGLIPVFVSYFNVRLDFLVFGIFYILSAGGDFLMIWMLRNEPRSKYVLDHAEKAGCWVFDEKFQT